MSRTTAAIAALATLTACATSSGVMERADGSYTVSAFAAPARGGAPGARRYAMEQAQAHCEKMGKRAVLTESPEDQVLLANATSVSSKTSVTPNYGQASSSGSSVPMAAGTSHLPFSFKKGR